MFVVHNLTEWTVKYFQSLFSSWTPCVLLSRPQLVRNHFLVSLPKKQQVDIVQPFGHFRWRECLCDNWKPSFLPFLDCRTFSRRVTARRWRQSAKNQVSTNQNSRNRWCLIVRRTICKRMLSYIQQWSHFNVLSHIIQRNLAAEVERILSLIPYNAKFSNPYCS